MTARLILIIKRWFLNAVRLASVFIYPKSLLIRKLLLIKMTKIHEG